MDKEIEMKILEINEDEFIDKILNLGAIHVGDFFQKRYVYDFNPVNPNKWIRLRTNGQKTTLTIKEIKERNAIDGYQSHLQLDELVSLIDYEDRNRIFCMHLGDNIDVNKIKKLGFRSVR